MAHRDNALLYGILGFLSGPIGGAVAGYYYADLKKREYQLNSAAKHGWDNPLTNAIVGMLFAPVSSTMFAWNCGKLEQQIDHLEATSVTYTITRSGPGMPGMGRGIEPQIGSRQWQQFVAQQTPPGNERIH